MTKTTTTPNAQTATAANGTPSPEVLADTLLRKQIEAANQRVEEVTLIGSAIRALESLKIATNLVLEVRARATKFEENSEAASEVFAALPDINNLDALTGFRANIARLTDLLS